MILLDTLRNCKYQISQSELMKLTSKNETVERGLNFELLTKIQNIPKEDCSLQMINKAKTPPHKTLGRILLLNAADKLKSYLTEFVGDDMTTNSPNLSLLPTVLLYGQFWDNTNAYKQDSVFPTSEACAIYNFTQSIHELKSAEKVVCLRYEEILVDELNHCKEYSTGTHVATGYALYKDKVWRPHTWCIQRYISGDFSIRQAIISPDADKILLYYGAVLNINEIMYLSYSDKTMNIPVQKLMKNFINGGK